MSRQNSYARTVFRRSKGFLVVESSRYYVIKNLSPEHLSAAYAIHTH